MVHCDEEIWTGERGNLGKYIAWSGLHQLVELVSLDGMLCPSVLRRPEAFSNEELNAVGLLSIFDRAVEVQERLHELFPDEPHADCDLWAIFRMVGGSRILAEG